MGSGECVKAGTLEELSSYCLGTAECATFAFQLGEEQMNTSVDGQGACPCMHPDKVTADCMLVLQSAGASGTQLGAVAAACRRAAGPQPNGTTNTAAPVSTIGNFKEASEAPIQFVFPNAVLYVRISSAGGLSAGAVAGIAVGAVGGAAALTFCAWLLLQRRQRAQQGAAHSRQKDCEEGAAVVASAAGCCCSCGRSTNSGSRSSTPPSSLLGRFTSPTLSGPGTLSTSSDALPELIEHVAAHEAAAVSHRMSSPDTSAIMEWEDRMLPQHLRPWVVDASQVRYMRRADGKLWELGSGASGKVYRVEYRGEVRGRLGGTSSGPVLPAVRPARLAWHDCALLIQIHCPKPLTAAAGCQGSGAGLQPGTAGDVCD